MAPPEIKKKPKVKKAKPAAKPKATKPKKESKAKAAKPAGKKKKDGPKRGLSAFMFFSQDNRDKIKEENPGCSFGEVGKFLGAAWGAADAATKAKYEKMAAADKERYEKEKAA